MMSEAGLCSLPNTLTIPMISTEAAEWHKHESQCTNQRQYPSCSGKFSNFNTFMYKPVPNSSHVQVTERVNMSIAITLRQTFDIYNHTPLDKKKKELTISTGHQ